MYVKSLNAKVLVREEKVALCNIKNGSFVKTSRSYFEYLEKLLEDNNGEFVVNKKDSIVKRNAYKLFQELCRICFYIPKEQLKQDNEFLYQIVYLSLTDRCNLKCKHCVASACIDKTDHMDTEDWKNVITQVVTLNPEQINLTGGEPLIRPDFCEILKYLRINYKGTITLSTNALLLDDKLTEMIKENVDGVSISLDGFDDYSCAKVRGDGVYDRVITGVRKLKKAGVENVSVSMLRTKYTYGHDNEFYKLCEELDVKPLIRRFAPSGRGEENQEELLPPMEYINKLEKQQLRCVLCQPGKKELNISENGDVYPCSPLSSMKTLLMGNLLEVPITEIIEKPGWKQELEKLRPWKLEKCKDCDVNLFCHSCINFIHGMQSDKEVFKRYCEQQKKHLEKILWGVDYDK